MSVVLTFATIHEALRAESIAQRLGLIVPGRDPGLIPLPPRVMSDCGFGLLIGGAETDAGAAVRALRGEGIAIQGVFSGKEKGYERTDQAD